MGVTQGLTEKSVSLFSRMTYYVLTIQLRELFHSTRMMFECPLCLLDRFDNRVKKTCLAELPVALLRRADVTNAVSFSITDIDVTWHCGPAVSVEYNLRVLKRLNLVFVFVLRILKQSVF